MKFIQQDQVAASRFSAGVRGYFQANMLTSWIARDQPGKNYLSETKQACTRVFTSILGLNAALMLASALSGCSGAVGTPPDTTPVAATPLAVSPAAADIFPDVPVTFTITGGKPTYSAFTSNSVVLPVNATVTGTTFTIIPGPVTAETAVDITVRDSLNASAAAKATVKPSTLINQITFTPSAQTATGCVAALCSGNDAQVVVRAALNGVVLRSRQIRFDVVQGSFKISSTSSLCTTSSCIVSTDEQGEATVRVVADAGAPTQVATLQISDVTGGQNRKYSFNIVQQISGVGILSTLPSDVIVIKGAPGVAGSADGVGKCPTSAQVDYLIFGGTASYSVVSSRPDIANVVPGIVLTSGGRFSVNIRDCGQAVFVITDATGRTIQTAMIDSQKGDTSTATASSTQALQVVPQNVDVGCGSKASVTLSGTGNFVAAIATSVPNNSALVMSPSGGVLPASLTFTRSVGNAPQITVNITDGKTIAQLNVTTPATCP